MRVFLCGLIGAAATTAAWLALEHFTQSNFGWLAVVVGVITGLCVRLASQRGTPGASGRGALAVILTLAAIVIGPQIYVQIIRSQMKPNAPIEKANVEKEVVEVEGDNDGAEEEVETDLIVVEQPVVLMNEGAASGKAQRNMSEWEMLWMSLGGLAAYIFGKNDGAVATDRVVVEERVDRDPNEENADENDTNA